MFRNKNATAETCMRQLKRGKKASGSYVQFFNRKYVHRFLYLLPANSSNEIFFFFSLSLSRSSSLPYLRHCCPRIHSMRIYSYYFIRIRICKEFIKKLERKRNEKSVRCQVSMFTGEPRLRVKRFQIGCLAPASSRFVFFSGWHTIYGSEIKKKHTH